MSIADKKWQKDFLARFSDRENIGIEEVYRRFFKKEGLQRECVLECLELVEIEYGLPAGLIRPSDNLVKLLRPVNTRNPLRWLFYRAREEDSESELNYQLSKRLRRHGTFDAWHKFETFADLVDAWCGRKPPSA